MKRARNTWIAFAICTTAVALAMTWVTLAALRLDRAEGEAQRRTVLDEAIRLALWRMDSTMTALVARESARPYFAYQAFYPTERAYTRMFSELQQGEVLVPSPLLTQASPLVKIHFQLDPAGNITSPQAPTGNMRDLTEVGFLSHEEVTTNGALLEDFGRTSLYPELAALLEEPADASPPEAPALHAAAPPSDDEPQQQASPQKKTIEPQFRNTDEYNARAQQIASNTWAMLPQRPQDLFQQSLPLPKTSQYAPRPPDIVEEPMRPLWLDEKLLLARFARIDGQRYIQGCWLDWPAIRRQLLDSIEDLLPAANLLPAPPSPPSADLGNMLASIPARLDPGQAPEIPRPVWTPMRLAVLAAWTCTFLSIFAIAALLAGALSLSKRRETFVSAVTHELRTPLTTFRMYTEMLATGLIKDETKKRQYIDTLHNESNRLSHLVENVLEFARLERGRGTQAREPINLAALLDRMWDRLNGHATHGGMELIREIPPGLQTIQVRTDPGAVEQILMNLVDNSTKYAQGARDRRIHLHARRTDGSIALRLRDHGPGIAESAEPRLFRPFAKSAREAAHSAPGVGLGLSLSRRLARNTGGDLRHIPNEDGACFELSLPIA